MGWTSWMSIWWVGWLIHLIVIRISYTGPRLIVQGCPIDLVFNQGAGSACTFAVLSAGSVG